MSIKAVCWVMAQTTATTGFFAGECIIFDTLDTIISRTNEGMSQKLANSIDHYLMGTFIKNRAAFLCFFVRTLVFYWIFFSLPSSSSLCTQFHIERNDKSWYQIRIPRYLIRKFVKVSSEPQTELNILIFLIFFTPNHTQMKLRERVWSDKFVATENSLTRSPSKIL